MPGAGELYLTGSGSPPGRGISPAVPFLPAAGDFRKQIVLTRMRLVPQPGMRAGTFQGGEAEGGALQRGPKVLGTGPKGGACLELGL